MPWQRKERVKRVNKQLKWAILPARVQKPSLTLFLFLRGQDAETEQLFPHFHKLLHTAFPERQYAFVLMLSSHRYWTHRTFSLSSSLCTSATFSFMSKLKSLFLHQRNSITQGSLQQRRAVVTFGFTTWPYERDVHPVSSLGQVDKKRSLTGHHLPPYWQICWQCCIFMMKGQ